MPKLTVVAKLIVKPESIEAARCELVKLIEPTRMEDGCNSYHLHQDNDDPAVFIFHENWDNEACLEKHRETEHYKSCFGIVGSMIREKAVNKMTLLEP